MKRILSFLSGVVLGSLVGATLALLLAPESGDDLRLQIRSRINALGDEVQRAASDRRAELQEQLATLRAPHHFGGGS